jgi:hypothetical protein
MHREYNLEAVRWLLLLTVFVGCPKGLVRERVLTVRQLSVQSLSLDTVKLLYVGLGERKKVANIANHPLVIHGVYRPAQKIL